MWHDIWTTLLGEFSDIPNVATITRISLRMILAVLLGGMLGYERERKARSAGLRTHILVALGTSLFVFGPLQTGMEISDLSGVLQGLIQGIGFLGAGAIIVRRSQRTVQGLTTAANIWATSGVGMLVGLGLEATAVLATVMLLIILAVIPIVAPSIEPDTSDQPPET